MDQIAKFDIRTSAGRESLAQHHLASDSQDNLTLTQVVDGLWSLVNYLGPRDWMLWQYGGFVVPMGHRTTRLFTLPAAVALGSALHAVSTCQGFADLLQGFDNPTQFDDTIFEVHTAQWCLQRPAVKSLRFAPRYIVLGREKRPDFEIETPIGRLVCECKRLHLNNQDWTDRLKRIVKTFEAAMQAEQISAGMRLEVKIHCAIKGDLSSIASRACREVAQAPTGALVHFGPFSLRLSPIGSKPMVNDCVAQHGLVRVGDTPTGITPEYTYLIVSSPWMEQALVRAMGALINAAHRQLPHERNGVIFIEGASDQGRQAAATRLIQPQYTHCLAVFIIGRGKSEVSQRDMDQEVVEWLFSDKPPPLVRRLQDIILWRSGIRLELLRRSLQRAT